RTGVDKNGKPWAVKMPDHYGQILRTEGMDHDPVDAFVGEHLESPHVFVVDQVDPDTKAPDEHKVMLGYRTADEAQDAYRAAYTDRADERVGKFHAMSVDEYKQWIKDRSATKKPLESNAALLKPGSREPTRELRAPNGENVTPLRTYKLGDILPKFDLSNHGPLIGFMRKKLVE